MKNELIESASELSARLGKLVATGKWKKLKKNLAAVKAEAAAGLLRISPADSAVLFFRLLPMARADEVFAALSVEEQGMLVEWMQDTRSRRLLRLIPASLRDELFEELPCLAVRKLVYRLDRRRRAEVMKRLGYPARSVATGMTARYVAVRASWTVDEALRHIREFGEPGQPFRMVYVTDDRRVLIDELPLRNFVLADPAARVRDLMDHQFAFIEARADQQEALIRMKTTDHGALPVVDSAGALIGMVTFKDALDIAEKRATAIFQRKSGILPLEELYSRSPLWLLYRKRIVWLVMLAAAGILSSTVITAFEHALEQVVMLAFFIPVLIGTGGNTGSQSATLIIRALSTGNLKAGKWLNVLRKEASCGLMLGATLGLLFFLRILALERAARIGLVVALTMVGIALWANLVGAFFPILFTKLKLDPAVASSPAITTIVDASGLLIYFIIAGLIL